MDIVKKNRYEFISAFLTSVILHTIILLIIFFPNKKEVIKGNILFIDLFSPSKKTNRVFAEKKSAMVKKNNSLHQNHSQVITKEKDLNSSKDLNLRENSEKNFSNDDIKNSEEKNSILQNLFEDEFFSKNEILYDTTTSQGPSIIELIKPVYPPLARKLGKEGKVLLRIYIDEAGRATKVDVIKKGGFGFDEAAIEAIKHSRFKPAIKNGITSPSIVIIPVRFVLEKK